MLKWFIVNTITLMILTFILPGFQVSNWTSAVLAVIVIGLINALVRPILSILTLPITILTLGLFSIILNALMLLLATSITPGFHIDTFWTALIASILMGFISGALNSLGD